MAWQRREERRATPPILEYFSRLITGAEGGAFHPRDGPDQELSNDHFHSFPPQATPLHPGFTPFSMKNSQARASETPPPPPRFPSSRVFTTFNGNAPLWSFPLLHSMHGHDYYLSAVNIPPLSSFCPSIDGGNYYSYSSLPFPSSGGAIIISSSPSVSRSSLSRLGCSAGHFFMLWIIRPL